MKRLRLWILGTALGTFVAGMSFGLAVPRVLAAVVDRSADVDPDAAYVAQIASRYGLSARQQRSLALVLQNANRERLMVLTSADPTQLPPALQGRLQQVHNRTEQYLRAVLDPAQRELYDRDSRPAPGATSK